MGYQPVERKHDISPSAVTRRRFLNWLGQGAVLSLSGAVLASCATERQGRDNGRIVAPGEDPQEEFPFEEGPSTDPIFEDWRVRIVDQQDLARILESWRLTVDGLVESPQVYSFADLVALNRTDTLVDLHCVEGWSVYDIPWNGVHLSEIFRQVKVLESATHVAFHTITGKYNGSLPISVALEPTTLLAYGIGGNTLPLAHGFPVRAVIPRLFGYKSAKYIERIELIDHRELNFWEKGGYDYTAEVPEHRLRPGKF